MMQSLARYALVETDSPPVDVQMVSVYGVPYVAVASSGSLMIYDISDDAPVLVLEVPDSYLSLDVMELDGSIHVVLTDSRGDVSLMNLAVVK